MTHEQRIEKIEAYLMENRITNPCRNEYLRDVSIMARELSALMEPEAGALRGAYEDGLSDGWTGKQNAGVGRTREGFIAAALYIRYPDTPFKITTDASLPQDTAVLVSRDEHDIEVDRVTITNIGNNHPDTPKGEELCAQCGHPRKSGIHAARESNGHYFVATKEPKHE